MALVVQKFGGSSVATIDHIRKAAEVVARSHAAGHRIVVVVSAMGDSTNRLVKLARETTSSPSTREMDMLLSSGEQVTIALMAMALRELGLESRSYLGSQVRLLTDSVFCKAHIREVETARLQAYLESGGVPVVAGFQGVDAEGEVTTFGRGGSDTTAVALAAALGADECQILTDVDGVYTTDPRVVPEARRLDRITFEEMIELASQGSRVLQIRAVKFAGKYNVPLRVLHMGGEGAGTLITFEESDVEAPVVSGIAFSRDEAEITVTGVPDRPGAAAAILKPVSDARIAVDMIVMNSPRDGCVDFSFSVGRDDFSQAHKLASAIAAELGAGEVRGNPEVAKLSIVGVGMRTHAGIATHLFETLAGEGVNVRMVSTSEIKISVLVPENVLDTAVRAVHKAFELDSLPAP
ncbi:MAG: aspartate kinase [Chromatiales bacterium]|nr:aspartate kinase [Chromatiales bacterium]MDH3970472.1 aspartate kinase [Rhodospirillales bacterium]